MKRRTYFFEEKKRIILDYIKKNPEATYQDIRKNTKLHPERIFNSLKEVFQLAKIKPPRTFDFKNRKERRKIIVDYIKKNPTSGSHTILKHTKINISNAFGSIEEAYKEAGIKYPRKANNNLKKRPREKRKKQLIKLIIENPLISMNELSENAKTNPYRIFKNIDELYKEAKVHLVKGNKKRITKKRNEIIQFIKENPLATQRDINRNCKTHVQDVFKEGIFEAYEKAGVKFPFERLKLYGVGIKEIRKRAKSFEDEIAIKLSGFGKVNKFVKIKRGVADIILERKSRKIIIEIKDYKNKEISISQIKQLNKYLEDSGCNLGILICHKKPKKDKFLIGKNKIFVLEKEELKKIPKIIDGSVV